MISQCYERLDWYLHDTRQSAMIDATELSDCTMLCNTRLSNFTMLWISWFSNFTMLGNTIQLQSPMIDATVLSDFTMLWNTRLGNFTMLWNSLLSNFTMLCNTRLKSIHHVWMMKHDWWNCGCKIDCERLDLVISPCCETYDLQNCVESSLSWCCATLYLDCFDCVES